MVLYFKYQLKYIMISVWNWAKSSIHFIDFLEMLLGGGGEYFQKPINLFFQLNEVIN